MATVWRVDAELVPDPPDDPVHLAREAVDEPGLEPADRRLADHRRRREKSTLTRRAARAKRASIETSIPGASTPPTYSPSGETMSKLVEVPKSTTMHGAP